jgi:transcriptional regulator with XRE-family HTH domain
MTTLGNLLKKLRQERGCSRRWIERRSQELYPEDKRHHLSHTYLRQLEEGIQQNPNPLKLKTLANIYSIDTRELLAAAGILDAGRAVGQSVQQPGAVEDALQAPAQTDKARQVMDDLKDKGIQAEYFFNHLMNLNDESLQLIQRLMVQMSTQEQAGQMPEDTSLSKKDEEHDGEE